MILPDDRSDETEAGLAAFKQEIMVVAKGYIEKHCGSKENIKDSNLERQMDLGLKELKTKIRDDNLIYGKTDKSDKPFLLTEEEYLEIAKPYVDKDKTISMEDVTKKENILNSHTFQIFRIFGVCDAQNCSRRLKSDLTNSSILPPACYFSLKDHKERVPGQPMPARGMVGAGTGSLGRELGNILAKVLDTLGDHMAKELGSELKSTGQLQQPQQEVGPEGPGGLVL